MSIYDLFSGFGMGLIVVGENIVRIIGAIIMLIVLFVCIIENYQEKRSKKK